MRDKQEARNTICLWDGKVGGLTCNQKYKSSDVLVFSNNLKKLKSNTCLFFLLRFQNPHLHLHWVDLPHYIENKGEKNLKWQLQLIY